PGRHGMNLRGDVAVADRGMAVTVMALVEALVPALAARLRELVGGGAVRPALDRREAVLSARRAAPVARVRRDACRMGGGARCAAAAAAAEAERRQHLVLERDTRDDRQRHREHLALAANIVAVLPAAGARREVVAQVRAAQRAPSQRRQLLADLRAGHLAAL